MAIFATGPDGLGESLGLTTMPSHDNFVDVPLSRPLVAGELIEAFDLTNGGEVESGPIEVPAPDDDVDVIDILNAHKDGR